MGAAVALHVWSPASNSVIDKDLPLALGGTTDAATLCNVRNSESDTPLTCAPYIAAGKTPAGKSLFTRHPPTRATAPSRFRRAKAVRNLFALNDRGPNLALRLPAEKSTPKFFV